MDIYCKCTDITDRDVSLNGILFYKSFISFYNNCKSPFWTDHFVQVLYIVIRILICHSGFWNILREPVLQLITWSIIDYRLSRNRAENKSQCFACTLCNLAKTLCTYVFCSNVKINLFCRISAYMIYIWKWNKSEIPSYSLLLGERTFVLSIKTYALEKTF